MAPNRFLPRSVPGLCWLRSDRRRFDTAPRRHAELVALLAVSGRMRYLIDEHIVTLGPGSLLWAHSDQSHLLLSESANFDMWVLVIAQNVLRPRHLYPPRLAANLDTALGVRILSPAAVEELAGIAATLRRSEDPDLMTAGLRWWTARAWESWCEAESMAGAAVHPAVRRAAEIIRAEPHLPLSAVATRAGLSASRLGRVFKSETGHSLTEYRTERRLAQVDSAMSETRAIGLTTAALDAGFGSYAQFYRVFVGARGVNPRRYYR